MKTGFSIRTWRMRLFCPEPAWLDKTQEYYRNVVDFYYNLMREHEELSGKKESFRKNREK